MQARGLVANTCSSLMIKSKSSSISKPRLIQHQPYLLRLKPNHISTKRSRCRQGHVCRAVLSPDVIFNVITVAVIPLYTLMITAPKKPITKSIMSSRWIFYIAALLYAFLLVQWNALPDIITAFNKTTTVQQASTSIVHTLKMLPLPDINAFSTIFTNQRISVIVWLHLLVLDLFQARWVYLDGLESSIPIAHSLVLCFMMGPLGLLSHFATKKMVLVKRSL